MLKEFNQPAKKEDLEKAIIALKANGIDAELVGNGIQAKARVFELLPQGADIMTQTSITLSTLEIEDEINNSGRYNPTRSRFTNVDPREKKKMGAAPEWTIGSVHAVTLDGKVLVASNTGSQQSSYVNGADHVIWVVGAQKLVADLDEAMKRIYEYVLPLESVRANKAYSITTGSFVSKLLIVNREVAPNRIKLIFVNEVLGF